MSAQLSACSGFTGNFAVMKITFGPLAKDLGTRWGRLR
jgi:hypothetical protein